MPGTFALQFANGSVTFAATLTGSNDLMATPFHIPTTDRLAGQSAGMRAHVAFAGSATANRPWTGAPAATGQTIVRAGRRTR